jgi:hypothetical protein
MSDSVGCETLINRPPQCTVNLCFLGKDLINLSQVELQHIEWSMDVCVLEFYQTCVLINLLICVSKERI